MELQPQTGKALPWVIFALAALGFVLSTVSLVHHYRTSPTDFCDIGENFNCDLVNRSPYSSVRISLGITFEDGTPLIPLIPVAGFGMAGYALLMLLARYTRNALGALVSFLGALGGLVFALRLTYFEKYVITVWCIVCLSSLATIFLITVISAWQMGRVGKNEPKA